jgi:hypothetical protein
VLRPGTAAVAILFSSAGAIATLSAGWHRVADSLASFFLVTAWAAVAGVVILLAEPGFTPEDRGAQGPHRTGRWWAAAATGLALVAAVLVAVLVADPEVRESALGPPAAFVAGALLIVATAAAMTVVALRAVSRVSDAGPGSVPVVPGS